MKSCLAVAVFYIELEPGLRGGDGHCPCLSNIRIGTN